MVVSLLTLEFQNKILFGTSQTMGDSLYTTTYKGNYV